MDGGSLVRLQRALSRVIAVPLTPPYDRDMDLLFEFIFDIFGELLFAALGWQGTLLVLAVIVGAATVL